MTCVMRYAPQHFAPLHGEFPMPQAACALSQPMRHRFFPGLRLGPLHLDKSRRPCCEGCGRAALRPRFCATREVFRALAEHNLLPTRDHMMEAGLFRSQGLRGALAHPRLADLSHEGRRRAAIVA